MINNLNHIIDGENYYKIPLKPKYGYIRNWDVDKGWFYEEALPTEFELISSIKDHVFLIHWSYENETFIVYTSETTINQEIQNNRAIANDKYSTYNSKLNKTFKFVKYALKNNIIK